MKKAYRFVIVGMICASCGCQTTQTQSLHLTTSAEPNVNNGQQITFEGEVYQLTYKTSGTSMALNEYIRPSESLDTWTTMIGVHHYYDQNSPIEAATAHAKIIKQSCPAARFAILKSNDGKRVSIDYMIWTPDGIIKEFNIFVYKTNPDGQGLVANQYVFRSYGKGISKQFKETMARRAKLLELVVEYDFPSLEK